MESQKKTTTFKFFNSGFCKYKNDCQYFHPSEICKHSSCRNKNCKSRHPKQCRYGDLCRRRSICVYKHDDVNKSEYFKVCQENSVLKDEIENMKFKLENTLAQLNLFTQHELEVQYDLNEIHKNQEKNTPIEHEIKSLPENVDDIEKEKENMKQELDRLKHKLKNTEISREEAELNNHKSIGIWMARESEIEIMMRAECPYCDKKFKKISTMINHYTLKHGGSCPCD